MISVLLFVLFWPFGSSAPKGGVVWEHPGTHIQYWALCIDDGCVDIPVKQAATKTKGHWRVPKPVILNDGKRHLLQVFACYRTRGGAYPVEVCSAPAQASYTR